MHVFGMVHFRTMAKPSNGVSPITLGEALYHLINHTHVFNFVIHFLT
jgi:hypothetical protein